MPVQTSKSTLFKKLGAKGVKAMKAHAQDDPKYGRVDLPPGIKNGVAKLTKLYFDTYKTGDNKGEPYLRGEAVVVFPKVVMTENGEVNIEGQTTSVMYPVCETKKDLDFNIANMQNLLKILGADKDELESAADEDGGYEAIAEAIQEAGPYLKFTTDLGKATKEYPNPRMFENWHGVKGLEDYDPQTSDDVEDETGSKGTKADVEEDEKPAKNGKLTAKKPNKEPEKTELTDEEPDLDALAEVADDDDNDNSTDAQKQLKDIALEAGLSKKWVEDVAKNWTAVAERIKEKQAEAGEETGATAEDEGDKEEEDAKEPAEGDIVKYKGAKDKKATEYEVTEVNEKKKTVNLKQIDDGKSKYLGVKFDDVEIVE